MRTTVFELGTRHGHPWTSRRGARVLAASSQATRPERGTQSARCGTARCKLRARQRPATPLATGETDVGPQRRPGSATVRRERLGKTVCDLGIRHGHPWTSRRDARVWPRRRKRRDRSGERIARDVAPRATSLGRRARGNALRRRWQLARDTLDHRGRPGNTAVCRQRMWKQVFELGTRLGHPCTSLRGARAPAASPQTTRPERGTQSARCGTARGRFGALRARQRPATPLAKGEKDVGPRRAAGHRSGSPGENRDNGLRIGHTARASLDVAARRRSAGCVVASHKTAARRAKRATWHRAPQAKSIASEAAPATPLATGEKDVGPQRAAGQRSGSPGENRDNVLRIGHTARAGRPERGAHNARCGTARDRFRA